MIHYTVIPKAELLPPLRGTDSVVFGVESFFWTTRTRMIASATTRHTSAMVLR